MLDERKLRKPEFVEGVPIVLCDGQTWHFPKPVIEMFPGPTRFRRRIESGEGGHPRLGAPIPVDGDPFWEKFNRLVFSEGMDHVQARLDMGGYLLAFNYDLTADQIEELLAWENDADGRQTEANESMWLEVCGVALGEGPKPLPRYLRIGLILASGNFDSMLLEDARDIIRMNVANGRMTPANRWIDAMIEAEEDAATEVSINSMIMG